MQASLRLNLKKTISHVINAQKDCGIDPGSSRSISSANESVPSSSFKLNKSGFGLNVVVGSTETEAHFYFNNVVIPDQARPEELAVHDFLDSLGLN